MNVWWSKTFPVCCLSLFVSQDIVEIWMVKFGEPPVIHQIRQGFPLPKITLYGTYYVYDLYVQLLEDVNFAISCFLKVCLKHISTYLLRHL